MLLTTPCEPANFLMHSFTVFITRFRIDLCLWWNQTHLRETDYERTVITLMFCVHWRRALNGFEWATHCCLCMIRDRTNSFPRRARASFRFSYVQFENNSFYTGGFHQYFTGRGREPRWKASNRWSGDQVPDMARSRSLSSKTNYSENNMSSTNWNEASLFIKPDKNSSRQKGKPNAERRTGSENLLHLKYFIIPQDSCASCLEIMVRPSSLSLYSKSVCSSDV